MTEPIRDTRPAPNLDLWTKAAAKSAPGGDVSALQWTTPDGIAVKPLYTAADLQGLPHTDTLPGFAPYLRGPQATMYAVRPWTIRQYAGFSTAEESNAFYRRALASSENSCRSMPWAACSRRSTGTVRGRWSFSIWLR